MAGPRWRLSDDWAFLAAFTVGVERWIDDPQRRGMAKHLREAMRSLGSVVSRSVVLAAATKPKKRALAARERTSPRRP